MPKFARAALFGAGALVAAAIAVMILDGLLPFSVWAFPPVPYTVLGVGLFVFAKMAMPRSKAIGWLWSWLIAPLFGSLIGVLIGDSKKHVGGDSQEKDFARNSQWVGAIVAVTLLPVGIFWVGTLWPPTLWLELVVLPTGLFIFGRRFSAAVGSPMNLRQWYFRLDELWAFRTAELVERDEETGRRVSPREPVNWWRALTWASLSVMAVAGFVGPWVPGYAYIVGGGAAAAVEIASWWPGIFLVGFWLLLPLSRKAAWLHHEDAETSESTKIVWEHQLQKTLGVTPTDWIASRTKIEFGPEDRSITIKPVPVAARANLAGLEQRVVTFLTGWTVLSADYESIELGLAEDYPEVLAARDALASSDGLILSFEDIPNTHTRPRAIRGYLNPDARPTAARLEALAARSGARLVEFDAAAQSAIIAVLPELTAQVRDRIAQLLGKSPWEVELVVESSGAHIDRVTILRLPALSIDPEKRHEAWRKLVLAIPGGSNGWTIEDDPVSGRIVLTYGEPRALPSVVPAESVFNLPITEWNRIPIGRDEKGELVSFDLKAGPHSLLVGGTGSGKTTAVRAMILSALARGFEIVFVDPIKRGAGLKGFIPHVSEFMSTTDFGRAADVAEAVYAEVRRRVDLIDEADGESWEDLPTGTVKPILFFLDEYASLVEADIKPLVHGPDYDKWEEETTAKSRIFSAVEKMAREARSAGIFIVLSLQRGDAKVIGGGVRDNLGTQMHLIPPASMPSPESLRMVFKDEASGAAEVINELRDGRPGFGVSVIDGGVIRGFRVCHIEKDDVPAWLEHFQVPPGTPLRMPQRPGEFHVIHRPAAAAEPVEELVGEFTFTLDDLDAPADPTTPATSPPPPSPEAPTVAFTFDD